MSTELMIPDAVPSYLVAQPQDAANAVADFMEGLSAGAPPRIKFNGTRFIRKEADGTEIPVDSLTISAVIVAARGPLSKSYYAGAYDPDGEDQKPDCYSHDGAKPAADAKIPQCDTCAGCPMNQFGTGTNAKGEPSKGKACRDKKVLVAWPGNICYQLDLPPTSLKNFASYTKQLSAKGVAVYNVKTEIGFDPTESFPVLQFKFGGFVPEAMIAQIAEMRESQEVKDIVEVFGAAAPRQVTQAPAPIQQPVQQPGQAAPWTEPAAPVEVVLPVFNIAGLANPHREAGKPSPGKARRTKAEIAEDDALEAANNPPVEVAAPADSFGLDLGAQTTEPAAATPPPAAQSSPSDEQLKSDLGLDF